MQEDIYIRHIKNQKKHWWFSVRRNIIDKVLYKYLKNKKLMLDYGAGSGTNIDVLARYGLVDVYEKNYKTYFYLKQKYKNQKKINILKKKELIKKKYDCILLADVLEHIKYDKKILFLLSKKLKRGGIIIITVPAFNFLFSQKDIDLRHYRRYELFKFKKILNKDFNLLRVTYFNFLLFIPISFLIILFKMIKFNYIKSTEKTPNYLINKLFYLIFNLETKLLEYFDFPFGLSILGIGEKK